MIIKHISDTHGFHKEINIDDLIKDTDLIIHSGDCSNSRSVATNEKEVKEFIEWYSSIKCDNKIYVAGNHDTSIEAKKVTKEDFEKAGIYYLENTYITINNKVIFGSPYTPTFNNWAFNKARHKINNVWKDVSEDVDILITHGPPKGILDVSLDPTGNIELCGDMSLTNHVERIRPYIHCFGHIHDCEKIKNYGYYVRKEMIFSNAAMIKDGHYDQGLIHKPIRHVL